ncbi:hypothetical protein KQX54_018129, partial [Cotesia glomerata]
HDPTSCGEPETESRKVAFSEAEYGVLRSRNRRAGNPDGPRKGSSNHRDCTTAEYQRTTTVPRYDFVVPPFHSKLRRSDETFVFPPPKEETLEMGNPRTDRVRYTEDPFEVGPITGSTRLLKTFCATNGCK